MASGMKRPTWYDLHLEKINQVANERLDKENRQKLADLKRRLQEKRMNAKYVVLMAVAVDNLDDVKPVSDGPDAVVVKFKSPPVCQSTVIPVWNFPRGGSVEATRERHCRLAEYLQPAEVMLHEMMLKALFPDDPLWPDRTWPKQQPSSPTTTAMESIPAAAAEEPATPSTCLTSAAGSAGSAASESSAAGSTNTKECAVRSDEQLAIEAGAAKMSEQIKRFGEMVAKHDLTYSFSDDHEVWHRGNESMKAIKAAAKELPDSVVKNIWGEKVRASVRADLVPMFEWKG